MRNRTSGAISSATTTDPARSCRGAYGPGPGPRAAVVRGASIRARPVVRLGRVRRVASDRVIRIRFSDVSRFVHRRGCFSSVLPSPGPLSGPRERCSVVPPRDAVAGSCDVATPTSSRTVRNQSSISWPRGTISSPRAPLRAEERILTRRDRCARAKRRRRHRVPDRGINPDPPDRSSPPSSPSPPFDLGSSSVFLGFLPCRQPPR